jgi:hypothetical protein
MATVGSRLRSFMVTAFVVLVTASGIGSGQAYAAAPTPSPTPQPTTGTAVALPLTLDPTSAHPGDSVAVSFEGWKSETCSLYYDQSTVPTGSCTANNGVLTGSLVVPTDATPNTDVPITACPTDCTSDNFTAVGSLAIVAPLATTQPTKAPTRGVVTTKPPPRHQQLAASSTSSHVTAFIAGGAGLLFIAAVLGLLLLRRRPPTIGQPPDITLVPHPDPGVVTVDPDSARRNVDARITIRLRPDEGRCRVEAMQR